MDQAPAPLLDALHEACGPDNVVSLRPELAPYARDETGRFAGHPLAVARPADAIEASALVRACAKHGVPVVPRGGNTGLVGGAVPQSAVLMSSARLTRIEVDPLARTVMAGSGATLQQVNETTEPLGLFFPVDHAARGTATVGGTLATNAGGHLTWRYGPTRSLVTGIEAVLADGRVISRLAMPSKDNTGYDLTSLLVGSEGTLAFITRARLKLLPIPPIRVTALAAVASMSAALELFVEVRGRCRSLEAAEYFTDDGLAFVTGHFGRARPLEASPLYVLFEAAGEDPFDELGSALADVEHVVAQNEQQGRGLWALRELQHEAVAREGTPLKLDVSVPGDRLPGAVEEIDRAVRAADASLVHFGHLGDGNVHVNVLGAASPGDLGAEILTLVAELGGSIAAEHGIGRLKRDWLHLSRSPAEIDVMRAIKDALDPSGLMNPGVLLPNRDGPR